jgi:hypothetical protein
MTYNPNCKKTYNLSSKKTYNLRCKKQFRGLDYKIILGSSSHQNESTSNHDKGNISKQPTVEKGGAKPNVMVAPPRNVHGLLNHPILGCNCYR